MRLDQRTIILVVVSLVVIVAVLLIGNPTAAPDLTPTPAGGGPVFAALDQTTIVSVSVTNNDTGETTVLTKDDGGSWTVSEATNSTDRATDQAAVETALTTLAALAASESFEADDLAVFGLDAPTHTLVLTASDDTTHTIQIGAKAAANPRYYALVDDNATTVYVVQQTQVDSLTDWVGAPPYVPPPTATATFTPSPNPLSEVEQTATAVVEQTAMAEITAEATGEATADVEATAEAAPEGTEEVTAEVEATEEATEEPTSVAMAETTEEATEVAEPEATAEVEATEEATAEVTAEATEEATPTPTPEPLPTLVSADIAERYADIPQSLSDEGFPQLGDPTAPVQVTIYGSFDSNNSRTFRTEVEIALIDRTRAGEVLLTYVPLFGEGTIPNGENAANAAVCAAQQEAFWAYRDLLFDWQGTLRSQAFTAARLEDGIDEVDRDQEVFAECLDSDLPGEVLTAARESADALEVSRVPAVFVNGEEVDADLDAINEAIDAAL
jgi:protein-disulfide isomerase